MVDGLRGSLDVVKCVESTQSVDCGTYIQKLEEMRKLSKRNAWKAVEAAYQEILELEGIKIEAEVYHLAVQAARALGNAASVRERLVLLLEDAGTYQGEAQNWLNELDRNYGRVEISLPENDSCELTLVTMPFPPDQRAAIEFAQARLAETGEFRGLLPVTESEYTLTPQAGGLYESQTFKPLPIASQGETTGYLEVAPAKIQQTKTQNKKHLFQAHIWFSASGGYGSLAKEDSVYYKAGSVLFADMTFQLRPKDVPLQFRASAGAGWFSSTTETENLSTVPLRGIFGVDFVNSRRGYISLGPTVGVEQNLGTKGVLSVGTNEVVMTDPALQPHTFIYGGRLMMGGKRVSAVVDYTHGLTEIRGLLPDYDNVVGTTNQLAENQWTAGFAVRAF